MVALPLSKSHLILKYVRCEYLLYNRIAKMLLFKILYLLNKIGNMLLFLLYMNNITQNVSSQITSIIEGNQIVSN